MESAILVAQQVCMNNSILGKPGSFMLSTHVQQEQQTTSEDVVITGQVV